jgi:hypothetical protein
MCSPTLEQVIAGADFARRGWHRLFEVADYLAHLVDGRTTGILMLERPDTYRRAHGLATAVKAAFQWYALDASPRPRFIGEAETYLAEHAANDWIRSPPGAPPDEQRAMLSRVLREGASPDGAPGLARPA